jgi:hypothetical protein
MEIMFLDMEMLSSVQKAQLGATKFPFLTFITEDGKVFPFNQEINEENITNHFKNINEKKIEKLYISEKKPEENENLNYKIVVGDTFEEFINQDKDILLYIHGEGIHFNKYIGWCYYCNIFNPTFEDLSSSLKDTDGLVIGKLDWKKNPYIPLDIGGVPSILFFPNNDKRNPILFSDERSVKKIVQFMLHYSSKSKSGLKNILEKELK